MVVDLTAIGVLITIGATAIVSILAQIQKSRCKIINLCCGFVKCNRELPEIEPNENEKLPIENEKEGIELTDLQNLSKNLKGAGLNRLSRGGTGR